MGFLAPGILAGLAALALPWWLHRLKARSSQRQPFPSTLLLEESERPVHVQRNIQYRLLLALRIALLAALIVAFSRPFLTADSTPSDAAPTVTLLVDDSYSMRGFDRSAAADALLSAGPRPALWNLRIPGYPAEAVDHDTLQQRLRTFTPGFERRDFAELVGLLDSSDLPTRVHLLTDLQASALPAKFADMLPGTQLILPPYPQSRTNAFIRNVRLDGTRVLIDTSGSADGSINVQVEINNTSSGRVVVDASRASYELPELGDGLHRLAVRMDSDDAWPEDNQYFVAIDRRPPPTVPVVVADADAQSLTYLGAALDPQAGDHAARAYVAGRFDARTLNRADWIIVDDPAALSPELQTTIANYLTQGGKVLAFSGPATQASAALPFVGNARRPGQQLAAASLTVRPVDTTHPGAAAAGDWSAVNVYRYSNWEIASDDQVLLELTNADPWVTEHRVGDGQLVFMHSGLDTDWTDFMSRGVFVGFIREIAAYLSGQQRGRSQFSVGDTISLATVDQLIDPAGKRRVNLGTSTPEQLRLDLPGFYTVYSESGERLIAANIDRRESILTPLDAELLTRWQADAGTARRPLNAMLENDQQVTPLWPALLILLLLIAMAETLLANRTRDNAYGA